jgi:hypothetical protein
MRYDSISFSGTRRFCVAQLSFFTKKTVAALYRTATCYAAFRNPATSGLEKVGVGHFHGQPNREGRQADAPVDFLVLHCVH